ncbi:MAG: hypothetical protein AB1806_10670 [Acidobacteriota bacterium]
MKTLGKWLKAVVPGLLLLGGLVGAAWWLLAKLGDFIRSLQSDLALAIVTAGLAGVVSVVSLALSKAYETRATIRQELRAKKLPVYEGIVKTLFAVLFAEKTGKEALKPNELVGWFAETTEKLSIWGSDELVVAFDRFKNAFSPEDATSGLLGLEDLILAIRKDLGHSGRKLKRGSILRLFITDIDEQLKRLRQRAT